MKRLLVPTDFSDNSKNAVVYAFNLAGKLGFKVQLVHVLELYKFASGITEAELISTVLPADNMQALEAAANKSFEGLLHQIESAVPKGVAYEYKVVAGHLINELVIESAMHDTELMVLAVASSQDLIARFTHTTLTSILSDAMCPVLLVPSGFAYKEPQRALLATDFRKSDIDMANRFVSIFGLFQPKIQVVHIAQKANDFKIELKFAGLKQLIHESCKYDNLSFTLSVHKNVVQGLLDNLKNANADMLLMLKEHEGFFKSLFEVSTTGKIAHFLKIPMISYREKSNEKLNEK